MSSTVTVFVSDRERVAIAKFVKSAQSRLSRGMELVALEASGVVLKKLASSRASAMGTEYHGDLIVYRAGLVGEEYVAYIVMPSEASDRYEKLAVGIKSSADSNPGMTSIGIDVLKTEFGVDSPMIPFWRDSFRELKSKLASLRIKFVRYVESGDESVFDLPESVDAIGDDVSDGDWFQSRMVVSI